MHKKGDYFYDQTEDKIIMLNSPVLTDYRGEPYYNIREWADYGKRESSIVPRTISVKELEKLRKYEDPNEVKRILIKNELSGGKLRETVVRDVDYWKGCKN